MTDGGSRLSRWSRMKAEARRPRSMRFEIPETATDKEAESALLTATDPDAAPDGSMQSDVSVSHGEDVRSEALPATEATAEELALPDVDTLDADSDYTPFMSDKVSDAIRNRALRKLWRSDPVLACVDGLNDYDEDYTDAAMVVAGMKSDYVVGRGMVDYEAEEARKRAQKMADEGEAVAADDADELASLPDEGDEPSEAPGDESDEAQPDEQIEVMPIENWDNSEKHDERSIPIVQRPRNSASIV